MAKSVGKHKQQRKTMTKTDQARAMAKRFAFIHSSIKQKFPAEATMKVCMTRGVARKFGISFTIPDRIATEINDKKKISGSRPLRITRIPSGGPLEFHAIVEEARKVSPPVKNLQPWDKRPNPKMAYHRCRLNDWHPHLFHYNSHPSLHQFMS